MRTTILTALSALSLACGPAPEALGPGQVELRWAIPPAGCAAAGVDTVEITLKNELASFIEQRPCADGALDLDAVPAGRYDLAMRGLAHGSAIHDAPDTLLVVRPDLATLAPTLVLTAIPAAVDLTWRFEDASACAARGVDTILIGLYDPAGALIASSSVPCEAHQHTLNALPAGSWTIGLTALPAGPTASSPITLKRAQRAALAISLE